MGEWEQTGLSVDSMQMDEDILQRTQNFAFPGQDQVNFWEKNVFEQNSRICSCAIAPPSDDFMHGCPTFFRDKCTCFRVRGLQLFTAHEIGVSTFFLGGDRGFALAACVYVRCYGCAMTRSFAKLAFFWPHAADFFLV